MPQMQKMLMKSNSFRRTANQKEEEIKECAEQLKQVNEKKDNIV